MSRIPEPSSAEWVKSSYSNANGGSCVEWAPTYSSGGAVPVRDSKDPEGPALLFPTGAWNSFITSLKANEFPTV